jgi:hypothetical protein
MGNSLFSGGKITIETLNNADTFQCGETISGNVLVDQQQAFESKKLQLSFIGSEHAFFDESSDKARIHYRNDEIITRLDFDLLDLAPFQNQSQIGKFSFPFSFQVP